MTTDTEHDPTEHSGLDETRPGHQLRDARERAGISRDSMAERLRISVAQLEALERDDYAELPAPAFVRGYFRAYARELGVDPDEYVAAYKRSGGVARDPEIRTGGVTDPASGGRGGMIGLLLITLVAAGGIAAWWYQQRMGDGSGDSGAADSVEQERSAGDDSASDTDTPDTASEATEANVTAGDTQAGSNGAASGEGETDTASDGTADDDAADAETVSVDVEAAEASAITANGADDAGEGVAEEGEQPTVATPDPESPASAADGGTESGTEVAAIGDSGSGSRTDDDATNDAGDPAASEGGADDDGSDSTAAVAEPGANSPAATDSPTRAATDAAGSGPDEITLEFSSRSWLEVYDDRERELVYTLYFGAEPITLRGWAPFEIFLGNSPAVTVRFNGEAIDKSAFTRGNNTARFVVDASGARSP